MYVLFMRQACTSHHTYSIPSLISFFFSVIALHLLIHVIIQLANYVAAKHMHAYTGQELQLHITH